MNLTTHVRRVPILSKSGVTSLLMLSFFTAWTGKPVRFVQVMVTRLYTDVK